MSSWVTPGTSFIIIMTRITDISFDLKRSDDHAVQSMAFEIIVCHILAATSIRHIFEVRCHKRKETIAAAATFLWKRPGVVYSSRWLYLYNLASRCLMTHSNPVMDAIVQLVNKPSVSDLSWFPYILTCCR